VFLLLDFELAANGVGVATDDIAADAAQLVVDGLAHERGASDDGQGDERNDQRVLDRVGTLLLNDETMEQFQNASPFFRLMSVE
jgi:hypothetical protein